MAKTDGNGIFKNKKWLKPMEISTFKNQYYKTELKHLTL